jgi:exodeoxyribonuclease III
MPRTLKLATWNVNSVRAHMAAVERFCREVAPDILCLQETKVHNDAFPLKPFNKLGFHHHVLHGQKGYHGVAIFSRELPLEVPVRQSWCDIEEARHAYCRIAGDVELHNFYVPAGGDLPDPSQNPKFRHKLDFMSEVTDWFRRRRRLKNRFILVGDLNVAPLETDVWNHKQLLKVVSHTPIEVEHMERWYQSHAWLDAVRLHVPPDRPLYSWWSYRARDWEAADKGRRLDHIWVTPALADAVAAADVYKPARGWDGASDHAPVIAEVSL